MSAFTGEIQAVLGNTEYRLMLGLRGVAELQAEYGKNLDPITSMGSAGGDAQGLPDFGVLMRVIAVSLKRFHPDAASDLDVVEGLLAQDMTLPGLLLAAAFPSVDADAGDAVAGKVTAGG